MRNTVTVLLLTLLSYVSFAAKIIVVNSNDSGPGSLRQAIINSNTKDTIVFNLGSPDTIKLQTHLDINKSITIIGPGRNKLLIQWSGSDPYDGYIIFSDSLTNVHISDMSFTKFTNVVFDNGCDSLFVSNCDAFGNTRNQVGGGSSVYASTAVIDSSYVPFAEFNNCNIYNNHHPFNIYSCRIKNSTFYSNYYGSISFLAGKSYVENSTFSNDYLPANSTGNCVGTIDLWETNDLFTYNSDKIYSAAKFVNSTFADFIDSTGAKLPLIDIVGLASADSSRFTFQNCIFKSDSLVFSTAPCFSSISSLTKIISLGGNISSDTSFKLFLTNPTDMNKTNPLIDTLAWNGGNTKTRALLPLSPAINNGISTNAPLKDERGYSRVGNIDIGAYEYQLVTTSVVYINESNKGISLFPNPAQEEISIKINNAVSGQKYFILDDLGRKVLNGTIVNENTIININQLPPGLYLFQIFEINEQSLKFIKE